MPKTAADFLEIIKVLSRQKVAFIVVGGVCGVLHGSPVTTVDLEVVHSRAPEMVGLPKRVLEGAHRWAEISMVKIGHCK
jgi:hypothetical protein